MNRTFAFLAGAASVAAACLIGGQEMKAQNNMMMMQNNAMSVTHKVAIAAHRGYWNCEEAGYARNSVAALRCAQEAGFAWSEFDVNMTADGVLLVVHEGELEGKRIDASPYSEFQEITLENGEKIPLLGDYLMQAKECPSTGLILELKEHSTPEIEDKAVKATVAELREHGMADPKKVMFISFSINICRQFARLMPGFTVQYLGDGYSPARLKSMGITGIDADFTSLADTPGTIDEARRLGMSVNCWTVNKTEDIRKMAGMKINCITTDFPMEARKILGSREIKAAAK